MIRCTNCDEPLVRHPGNGGQWLGANPPRDWMTCYGGGLRHTPDLPPPLNDRAAVESWLAT